MRSFSKFLLLPFILLALLINVEISSSQNLVPNPSFEDTLGCPQFYGQIDLASGWSSYGISPDYFNSCNSSGLGVPINNFGNQNSIGGNAYGGIRTYNSSVSNLREFIGIKLLQTLIPNQKYFISFYASLADTFGFDCGHDKIGLKFSTISYSDSIPPTLSNSAHLFSINIINDKINWAFINGSFIADSAYEYLIIGNFFDDAHIDTLNCFLASYYYIDQVCVSIDSLTCSQLSAIAENNINDIINAFPNPSRDFVTITFQNRSAKKLELYNSLGQIIYYSTIKTIEPLNINVGDFKNGVYYLKVYLNNGIIVKKIIIRS